MSHNTLAVGKFYKCIEDGTDMNLKLKGAIIVITKIDPGKELSISYLLDDGYSGKGVCTPEFAGKYFVPN